MASEGYEPVSCDYHDLLEAAAVHHKRVVLEFDLEGVRQEESGTIGDVYTSGGAEFVRFQAADGPMEIRLDHIISMKDARS
jgi:Rho-binding antiterminator